MVQKTVSEITTELLESLADVNDAIRKYGDGSDEATEALSKLHKVQEKQTKSLENQTKALDVAVKAVDGFSSAVGDALGAIAKGSTDMAVLSGSVRALGGGVGGSIKKFAKLGVESGKLGKGMGKMFGVVGIVITALGGLVAMAIEQTSEGFKSFKTLSKSGLIASGGMTELGENLRKSGIPLDKFTRLATEGAETLARFSGGASAGAAHFVETMGIMRGGMEDELRRIGFETDEIGETVLAFQKLQQMGGVQSQLSSRATAKAAKNLGFELDEVARLTGVTRKEQMAIRAAALSEARFAAGVAELRAKGDAESIAKADRAEAINAELMARGQKDLAQGVRDSIFTGTLATAAAVKANISTGGMLLDANAKFLNNTASQGEYVDDLGKGVEGFLATQLSVAKYSDVAGKSFADTAQMIQFNAQNTSEEGRKRIMADRKLATDKQNAEKNNTENLMKMDQDLESTSANITSFFLETGAGASIMAEFTNAIKIASDALHSMLVKLGIAPESKEQKSDRLLGKGKNKVSSKSSNEDLRNRLNEVENGDSTTDEKLKVARAIANPMVELSDVLGEIKKNRKEQADAIKNEIKIKQDGAQWMIEEQAVLKEKMDADKASLAQTKDKKEQDRLTGEISRRTKHIDSFAIKIKERSAEVARSKLADEEAAVQAAKQEAVNEYKKLTTGQKSTGKGKALMASVTQSNEKQGVINKAKLGHSIEDTQKELDEAKKSLALAQKDKGANGTEEATKAQAHFTLEIKKLTEQMGGLLTLQEKANVIATDNLDQTGKVVQEVKRGK